ncbi:uncharacterized protein EDB91DRAFT_1246967 [Suillus paluster]|uniref:uncharacterized protein n=1 Tax=Suillus paluster TaxID=48578 RepID=UPI001B870CA9|nr:uncharacterized protein EDB91DRAFT_1246967 [Suillus paluster]KAG1744086.1 hypothetical protein EDB91DRAFT_1246967 [Suillus paluster]
MKDIINAQQLDISHILDELTTILKYKDLEAAQAEGITFSFLPHSTAVPNGTLLCNGKSTRDRNRKVTPMIISEKFAEADHPLKTSNNRWLDMLNTLYVEQLQSRQEASCLPQPTHWELRQGLPPSSPPLTPSTIVSSSSPGSTILVSSYAHDSVHPPTSRYEHSQYECPHYEGQRQCGGLCDDNHTLPYDSDTRMWTQDNYETACKASDLENKTVVERYHARLQDITVSRLVVLNHTHLHQLPAPPVLSCQRIPHMHLSLAVLVPLCAVIIHMPDLLISAPHLLIAVQSST